MPGRAREDQRWTTACEALQERHDEAADHHHQTKQGRSWPSWTAAGSMVDTETGRILRSPGWTHAELPERRRCPRSCPSSSTRARTLTAAGERRASYSLCDLNGHINNSFYLDIACDALPLEVAARRRRCPSPPSSTTVRSRWGPERGRCSMPPRETAGMCWAARDGARSL